MCLKKTIHLTFDHNFGKCPPYCRSEMYAGRVACCSPVSLVGYATGQTDGRTYARPLPYAFRCLQMSKLEMLTRCLSIMMAAM